MARIIMAPITSHHPALPPEIRISTNSMSYSTVQWSSGVLIFTFTKSLYVFFSCYTDNGGYKYFFKASLLFAIKLMYR